MYLNQEFSLFSFMGYNADWARIHFIENPGMAFGLELEGSYGKLILSLFRIVAIAFLSWFIYSLIKKGYSYGVLLSFSLILAGAAGNIIDSAFYGLIFSESIPYSRELAEMRPIGEGYAGFLHGKVVDMLYFPMWRWPDWMPLIGGKLFFSPVFNIADSAITIGVFSLLLFNRGFFKGDEEEEKPNENETKEEEIVEQVENETTEETPAPDGELDMERPPNNDQQS